MALLQEAERAPAPKLVSWPLAGVVALLSGWLAIVFAAGWEVAKLRDQPWVDAIVLVGAEEPWEGALPVRIRKLSADELPVRPWLLRQADKDPQVREQLDRWRERAPETAELFLGGAAEQVILAPSEAVPWGDLLAEGRPPRAGAFELVAGELCRFDSITLDGLEFTVVGRLERHAGSLAFAYLLPEHPEFAGLFAQSAGGGPAWLDPDGQNRLLDTDWVPETGAEWALLPPMARANGGVLLLTLAGLIGVAIGGALLQIWTLRKLAPWLPFFRSALESLGAYPRTLAAYHLLLYAALFGGMAVMAGLPVQHLMATQFVQYLFSEGELGYVGEAYQSGRILAAAVATWTQNYLVVTLGFTALPSLLVLPAPLAIALNVIRFALAGAVLSPQWIGSAGKFVYHAITMTLELECYILVSYFITVFVVRVFQAFSTSGSEHSSSASMRNGLAVFGGGVALVGIMLFLAALYEAATLILFGAPI